MIKRGLQIFLNFYGNFRVFMPFPPFSKKMLKTVSQYHYAGMPTIDNVLHRLDAESL
jgi:hypothetical protein